MSTREILEAARALIANPKSWCQGVEETSDGRHCAAGAIQVVAGDYVRREEVVQIMREVIPGGLMQFNDDHTHPEVMDMFDLAIARARQDETAVVEEWREVCGLPELAAA